jgi:hypothetical protein
MRFVFAFCLAVILLAPIVTKGADRRERGSPWIATAGIIRNGQQSDSGVYLKSGLIITAAHLTAFDANMSVRIADRVVLPAKVLKQRSSEDVDLNLLLFDEQRLSTSTGLPQVQLCEEPPWPGDSVIGLFGLTRTSVGRGQCAIH